MRVKEESEIAGLKLNIPKTRIMASSPIISCQIEGEKRKQWHILFSWVPKSLQTVTEAMKLNTHAPWKKHYDKPRQYIKKQRYYFVYKGPSSQGYGFSSSHVWMWELDYKESWA